MDLNSPSPTPPYTNWATAATVIQDAVNAAAAGDEIVVTNGTYATGGRTISAHLLTNRVAVPQALSLRSVNGPEFTVIKGYQEPDDTNGSSAVRCVYLSSGASLSGFTLTNGATHSSIDKPFTEENGGGVWCASATAVVSNCVLAWNSAYAQGGGAYGGTLNNCVLIGNSDYAYGGGGAYGGTLNNCALIGNSVFNYYGYVSGGGAADCTLNNCTLTGNAACGYYYGGFSEESRGRRVR